MISKDELRLAYGHLASIHGASFDPKWLVRDVAALAHVYQEPADFARAVSATARAIELARGNRIFSSSLTDDYEGWSCLHFQPRVGQGVRATMRLMYRPDGAGVLVRVFGDRRLPADFYQRMAEVGRVGPYDGDV